MKSVLSNLDSDALALFSVGNSADESTLNTGDTVTLFANGFNFDGASLPFLDRRRLWCFFGVTVGVTPAGSALRSTLDSVQEGLAECSDLPRIVTNHRLQQHRNKAHQLPCYRGRASLEPPNRQK